MNHKERLKQFSTHCSDMMVSKLTTEAIIDAYEKLDENQKVNIDEIAKDLHHDLTNVAIDKNGRVINGLGNRSMKELLGRLGIFLVAGESGLDDLRLLTTRADIIINAGKRE